MGVWYGLDGGPDGAPTADFLSDSGYGLGMCMLASCGQTLYGGSGMWGATYK
ncbi:MAG: hypothetical protein ACLP1X_02475 [Polyangiaceae bacterium]|jgi:hypothetical protein